MGKIVELIEGGYAAQLILTLFIWGTIALLAAMQRPIPDPLLDAGFTVLGFYFRTLINQQLPPKA